MKKLNILFLPLIFATTLSANDKIYSFIGIQAASSNIEDTNVPTIGLKYGQQSENIRTSLSYNYGKNSNNDYHLVIVQMDTGILSNTFTDSSIKPYIGASLGYMYNKRSGNENKNGLLYGANAGLTYIVNDSIDLDLGYRFMKANKIDDIDSLNDVTFSMNYFY